MRAVLDVHREDYRHACSARTLLVVAQNYNAHPSNPHPTALGNLLQSSVADLRRSRSESQMDLTRGLQRLWPYKFCSTPDTGSMIV